MVLAQHGLIGAMGTPVDSVFELFKQDSATLERSQGGLGIGLTIVKRLIELHGGTIEVRSGGLGRGAQFTCSFARVHKGLARGTVAGDSPLTAASPRRVLVVEDNPDIRESLGLLLKMWGHGVEFAETGPDGLSRAHAGQPDVALIDIGLPGLSGNEVARRIRSGDSAWARGVKLVALTGYGRDTDRDEALDAGFDVHLVKPIDPDILARTLQGG